MDLKLGAERIQSLVKEKGSTVNKMLTVELHLSKSIVDNMIKGSKPSADKLTKIAEYLGTSIPYLLGESDDPAPAGQKKATPKGEQPFDDETIEAANQFKSLSPEDRARAMDYLALLHKQDNS